jgi:hypothetical protein
MKPKEKAKELVEKFYWDYDRAKQCALIVVDEVLGQFKWRPKDSLSYWEEVKQEINNL